MSQRAGDYNYESSNYISYGMQVWNIKQHPFKPDGDLQNRLDADLGQDTGTVYQESAAPQKWKASVSYMKMFDVLDNKEDNWLSVEFVIATSMDPEHNNRPVATHRFTQGMDKDLWFHPASCTVGLPGWTFNYERILFLVRTALVEGAIQNVIPPS